MITICFELDFQEVDGQDKGVVVKLTYDRLTVTRPSGVELLAEGMNMVHKMYNDLPVYQSSL